MVTNGRALSVYKTPGTCVDASEVIAACLRPWQHQPRSAAIEVMPRHFHVTSRPALGSRLSAGRERHIVSQLMHLLVAFMRGCRPRSLLAATLAIAGLQQQLCSLLFCSKNSDAQRGDERGDSAGKILGRVLQRVLPALYNVMHSWERRFLQFMDYSTAAETVITCTLSRSRTFTKCVVRR